MQPIRFFQSIRIVSNFWTGGMTKDDSFAFWDLLISILLPKCCFKHSTKVRLDFTPPNAVYLLYIDVSAKPFPFTKPFSTLIVNTLFKTASVSVLIVVLESDRFLFFLLLSCSNLDGISLPLQLNHWNQFFLKCWNLLQL